MSLSPNSSPLRRITLAVVVFTCLYVPFANKPVHIDDANFLMLAEGAARDPWRPHSHLINWSGKTEPAFDILANPPGIAWYLAPVRKAPDWVLHLWMLPWLILGAWGCRQLGRDFVDGDGFFPALYLLTSPVIVIAAQALTPDLPLFACMTAGIAGFASAGKSRPWFAILAGCGALFRYSGGTAIPLLLFLGWRRGGWRGACVGLLSALPLLLLILHDLHAYGKIHLLTMIALQNDAEHKSFYDALHNWVAGTSMLGGAVIPPVLVWRRESACGAIIGAVVGLEVSLVSGLNATQTVAATLAISAGTAALALAFAPTVREPFLSVWAIGGSVFFLTTRFAATRYWAAFVPAVGLLTYRNARNSPWLIGVGITVNCLLSLGIAIDDLNLAIAYRDAARRVASTYEPGSFAGHWGWQHYLEQAGWSALEQDTIPSGIHARAVYAGPQPLAPSTCLELVETFSVPDRWPGPRIYSMLHRAFYHSGVRGRYVPWTLSDEPYDVFSVYRTCESKETTQP